MKAAVSGVPGRPSITMPTAIEAMTVALQIRKNGSRKRGTPQAAGGQREQPGGPQHPASAHRREDRGVVAVGRLQEVGDDGDGGRDAQDATDRDVACAYVDLLGVAESPQLHLQGDRPIPSRDGTGGASAAQRRALALRRIGITAPCSTSARSIPPASPQTGASRWSPASARSPPAPSPPSPAGGGGWALATGVALALAELPWFFAFGARWRLLDDALGRRALRLARRPHRRLGDRPGRRCAGDARPRRGPRPAHRSSPCSPAWPAPRPTRRCSPAPRPATNARSCSTSPSSSSASSASPTPARSLRRSDPSTTCEARAQSRTPRLRGRPLVKAERERPGRVGAADGDLEVQVRAGGEAGRADAADQRAPAATEAPEETVARRGARSGCGGRCRGRARS